MKKVMLAITVGFALTAVTVRADDKDSRAAYEQVIASLDRLNEANRDAGLPEFDMPVYEEWLALQENDSSGIVGDGTQPRRAELMKWSNKGILDSKGRATSLDDLSTQRRARLYAHSLDMLRAKEDEMAEARTIIERAGIQESAALPEGGVIGLVGHHKGIPRFNITFNRVAADTISVDEVWPGGSSGLNLTGTNALLGIWDGGDVLTNHYEFTPGGPSRAIDKDGVSSLPVDAHPTAVAGTMAATGRGFTNSQGMAYQTTLWAYDWFSDIESEMNSAYANDVRVSNHSYGNQAGWGFVVLSGGIVTNAWWGDVAISQTESHWFGFYFADVRDTDAVAYGNPHSLPVWAAGNERLDAAPPAGTSYVTFSNGVPFFSNAPRSNDFYKSGYDTISDHGLAKNVLTIGAVSKIPGGYAGTSSVQIAAFSSFGPTDDGRIKPDVVAAGVGLFTPIRNPADPNNPFYYTTNASGTSFSSPSAAGAVGLLTQLRGLTKAEYPYWASTLKALIIHTADEAAAPGPDYKTGWGLVNAQHAAQLVEQDYQDGDKQYVKEVLLNDGDFIEFPVVATGGVPLKVTICWTDPAGDVPPEQLNPTNRVLVNDLDLRIVSESGSTNYPWILTPTNPSANASTGDNNRDNVEQVVVTNATPSAAYTIRITHKGVLVDDEDNPSAQGVSIIISGIIPEARPDLAIADHLVSTEDELVAWPSVVGQNYRVQTVTDVLDGTWTNLSAEISASKTNTVWTSGVEPDEEVRFYRLILTN